MADPSIYKPGQAHTLLSLPTELRARIIAAACVCDEPIALNVEEDGSMIPAEDEDGNEATILESAQLLRTCHQILDEGTPILYGQNILQFDIREATFVSKAQLPEQNRAFMSKLCLRYDTTWEIDLNGITAAYPMIKDIHIISPGPGPLLLPLVLQMTDFLPNEQFLRDWPRLYIVTNIPVAAEQVQKYNEDIYEDDECVPLGLDVDEEDNETYLEMLRHYRHDDLPLEDVRPWIYGELCGLGFEMPNFRSITLEGSMTNNLRETIAEHECDFGDCGFEHVRSEPEEDGYQKHVYEWKKKEAE